MAKKLKHMKRDFKRLENFLAQLPRHAANAYENFVQDNFEREAFEDKGLEQWPKRKRTKGKGSRKLLVNSGALRRSFSHRIEQRGKTKVIVFSSNVPYAKIHNEGGVIKGSAKVRAHSRRTKFGKVNVRSHQRKVNFRVPQRQFMGESKSFDDSLQEYIQEQLIKISK